MAVRGFDFVGNELLSKLLFNRRYIRDPGEGRVQSQHAPAAYG